MEDLTPILEKCLDALKRDITCLLKESTNGLTSTRATSLSGYIKLLRDIMADEKETEEELRERVKAILAESQGTGKPGGS